MGVDVEPEMRIAAAVAWKAAANISLLVRASTLLDEGCCSSCCYCCCCGRFSSTRRWWSTGSPPTKSLVELSCVSCRCWICVSHGPNQLSHGIQTGKKQHKNNNQSFLPYYPLFLWDPCAHSMDAIGWTRDMHQRPRELTVFCSISHEIPYHIVVLTLYVLCR